MTLDAFEILVLSQQPAHTPWTPVTPFDFASRKAIEGEHPQRIKDILRPTSVLDVGAGPGHLVRLLRAIGVDAVGGDVNDSACDYYLDITDPWLSHPYVYDLVVFREVNEHLTLRQMRHAVTNLCRLSTRCVYGTTRFHPNPTDILDVATHDTLDPTHISLVTPQFLRLLFTLEGFRWRGDLAEQMDWKGYGRTFVFERHT